MNETHPDKVKILFQEETGEIKSNTLPWRYEEQPRAVQIGRVVAGETRWSDVSRLSRQNVIASGTRISFQIGRNVPLSGRQLNRQENGQSELHGWVIGKRTDVRYKSELFISEWPTFIKRSYQLQMSVITILKK